VTGTGSPTSQAPHFHRNGSGGAIAGKFYVAGGTDSVGAPVTALDVYDPAIDTWKALAPLPIGGPNIGAVIQGKLFVIVTHQAYIYDLTTNKWNPKAAPKFGHGALVLVRLDDKPYLLAVGGYRVENGSVVVNNNELYTP
jgi:Kelch motif protein